LEPSVNGSTGEQLGAAFLAGDFSLGGERTTDVTAVDGGNIAAAMR